MKIKFIVSKIPFGGAEKQMLLLAKQLVDNNCEIEILEVEGKEDKTIDGVKILGLNKSISWGMKIKKYYDLIKFFLSLKNRIKKSDIVITFGKPYILIKLFFNIKLVYSIREYDKKYFKGINKYLLKKIDVITTNNLPSYILAESINSKTYLVNNILEFKDEIRCEVIKNKEYIIVSNISERKNLLLAIEAFSKLEKKGFSLKIIGKVLDKTYFEMLKNKSNKNIEFLGFLSNEEIQNLYKSVEGVIHTSLLEGTPNALLDAIKYQKPFLCLDTPENISFVGEVREYLIMQSSNKKIEDKVEELNYLINKKEDIIIENNTYLLEKIKYIYNKKNADYFLEIIKDNFNLGDEK